MNALSRSFLLLASVIFVTALVPIFGCPTGGQGQSNLASRVAALEAKLANISVVQGDINGLAGPHLIIEGINLHLRDGSGATDDNKALNGLGNLIVGYNELPPSLQFGRTGSHNVVIGSEHQYTSAGGLVAGQQNSVTGAASSVSGGSGNLASGNRSSVSGGGSGNVASGIRSSVSGGSGNVASGQRSSVSGGISNVASGNQSSVSGGVSNDATGGQSSVSGGQGNLASGLRSSVSGGGVGTAAGTDDWVAGTLFENN